MGDDTKLQAMPVEEALANADEWIKGVTQYVGATGWRIACAALAAEVRRLRATDEYEAGYQHGLSDGRAESQNAGAGGGLIAGGSLSTDGFDIMTPHRVQLSRKKGWRMPDNTVNVARPGRWGNPHQASHHGQDGAVRAFERDLIGGVLDFSVADVRRDLRGKNLACWCKPSERCHADVLLMVANA